jgi:hypothetical protein
LEKIYRFNFNSFARIDEERLINKESILFRLWLLTALEWVGAENIGLLIASMLFDDLHCVDGQRIDYFGVIHL